MIFRTANFAVKYALAPTFMCVASISTIGCMFANNQSSNDYPLHPPFMIGIDPHGGECVHITYYANPADGQMQFSGDQTLYDWDKCGLIVRGKAKLVIGGQNSKLEADAIFYDRKSGIVSAEGNATLTRKGQSRTGPAYRFKINSPQYLVTVPKTLVIDPLGYPVRDNDNSPGSSQFDERLRVETQPDGKNIMRAGPIPYPGGYRDGGGYRGDGSYTGDFGSAGFQFVPGKGIEKFRGP